MKLSEITAPTLRQEVLKVQQDLIDQGWDDVVLENDKDQIHVGLHYGTWGLHYTASKSGWKQWYVNQQLSVNDVMVSSLCSLAAFKVHDMVKFAEKPDSLAYVKAAGRYTVAMSKLKPLIEAGELKSYTSSSVFAQAPVHPGTGFRSNMPFGKYEKVAIVYVGPDYYLLDLTGASSYARYWAYVDDKA